MDRAKEAEIFRRTAVLQHPRRALVRRTHDGSEGAHRGPVARIGK